MKRIGLLNIFNYKSEELKRVLQRISELGEYEIESIEDFNTHETIASSIWGLINLCDVLIAFLDKESESLYYEIGLAHGAGKPVIIITDHEFSLPPELRGQRIMITSNRNIFDNNFLFQLKESIEDSTRRRSGYFGPRGHSKKYSSKDNFQLTNTFRDLFSVEGPRRNKYFEEWFAELATGIEGWEIVKPESFKPREGGFDLVIWNSQEDSELAILGNPIAVEIKAIRSMNSSMLHEFLYRSKKSGIKGLILATTGSNDSRTRKLLNRLRAEEGISAIALDRDDLINVREPDNLLSVIKAKVRELLYGKEF